LLKKRIKQVKMIKKGIKKARKWKKINKKLRVGKKISAAVGAGIFIIAPGKVSKKALAPFKKHNFAHRGLHSVDKSIPENSLSAFDAAASAGYGIELDVQLSKDHQVVVFHDNTLNRVTGVDARVDSKTYDELHAISLCNTDQTVPLFSDVLDCIRGRGPLIVELKTGKHNHELCRKTLRLLKKYNGPVCIESFDPRIVMWFRFHAPRMVRGQLACPPADYTPEEASRPVAFILGNCLMNFLGRPQFIAYKIGKKPLTVRLAEKMGAMKVCWTSREWEHEKKNDAVIFEFYKPGTTFKTKK